MPGGHRRYSHADIEDFLASMRQPAVHPVPRYGRNAGSVTG
jgi:hypothetical protein